MKKLTRKGGKKRVLESMGIIDIQLYRTCLCITYPRLWKIAKKINILSWVVGRYITTKYGYFVGKHEKYDEKLRQNEKICNDTC